MDEFEEEELGSSAKGKRGELIVIGELLRHGFEVFTHPHRISGAAVDAATATARTR